MLRFRVKRRLLQSLQIAPPLGLLTDASGQSWKEKLGEPCLLVPRQLLSAPFPNYIKLDSESGELSWRSASDTWIPEDELYDHLVLKVAKD